MRRQGTLPTDVRLAMPRRCLPAWAEARLNIAMRLSQTRAAPMESISDALVLEEMLRIVVAHIADGYPSDDDVIAKTTRRADQLRERANMAETIEGLEKRIAALEGSEPDAGV